jgi:ppGpp synthetase/RelA/SpoT-type nucleotidyltranferase
MNSISKTLIRKIGKNIKNNIVSDEELIIFNEYRNTFIEVMQELITSIKDKLPKPLFIARRLKRLESIKIKLQRFPQMELDRMQDIGGTRAVFNTLDQVKEYINNIKIIDNNSFKIIKENDYITTPKEDGYRSYHIVFECLLDNLKGYRVELQVRDLKEHYWATAVEILSIINKSNNLKIGKGEEYYKRFFYLSSKILHNEYNEETIKELKELDKQYKILDILKGFSLGFNSINTEIKDLIYIIYIDYNTNKVNINPFHKNSIEIASILYKELEKKDNINAVLIDTSDIKNLEEAYPNYFGDSKKFINIIERKMK